MDDLLVVSDKRRMVRQNAVCILNWRLKLFTLIIISQMKKNITLPLENINFFMYY